MNSNITAVLFLNNIRTIGSDSMLMGLLCQKNCFQRTLEHALNYAVN